MDAVAALRNWVVVTVMSLRLVHDGTGMQIAAVELLTVICYRYLPTGIAISVKHYRYIRINEAKSKSIIDQNPSEAFYETQNY